MGLARYGLAGLGLILAFGLLTLAMAKALDAPGAEAMPASIQQSDSSADTSVPTGDGEDEEAFPSLLTIATITSLVSYLTLPDLTGLSFYHSPLLQPPQPGLRR